MTDTTAGTLPVVDDDPYALDVLEAPSPLHARLRDAGPLVYLSRYDVHAVARYAEVHEVLSNWQGFESAAGVGLSDFRHEKPWRTPSLLLEADPPHHDAPRRVLRNVLGPPALAALRESWHAEAGELVDRVLTRTRFDAFTDIAQVFPLRVFPDAVGIGRDGRENLLPYGNMAFNAFGPRNDLVAADAPRVPELSAWVNAACAREALSEDGFGARIWAAADRGDITHEQAPLVVRSLLTAGVDITVHGIGAALLAFATNPRAWAALRENPRLARVAFDEAVRWHTPVQKFFRTTTREMRIAGTTIPAGRKVLTFLGSANRDPRRWVDPDVFDPTRDPSGHVGFGMGLHHCVGQHVARLEAEAVLTALAARVEHIELAGPVRRRPNNIMNALASVPVTVTLAR
ncbi:cytochrome P450 [Embleya sp. MST-111070]|uniref:cytochrome P450 n=1 Tax=Embleya sp. MST-111070 TaxID=3398231 RepID=UPI003F73C273